METIRDALKECRICKIKESKLERGSKFIVTNKPGELIGVDTMEILRGSRVIVAVDYFSRKI